MALHRVSFALAAVVLAGAAVASCLLPTYDITASSSSATSTSTGTTSSSSSTGAGAGGSGSGGNRYDGGPPPIEVEMLASDNAPHSVAAVDQHVFWIEEPAGTISWLDLSTPEIGTPKAVIGISAACAIDVTDVNSLELVAHLHDGSVVLANTPLAATSDLATLEKKVALTVFPDWDSCRISIASDAKAAYWFDYTEVSPEGWQLMHGSLVNHLHTKISSVMVTVPGTVNAGSSLYIGFGDVGTTQPLAGVIPTSDLQGMAIMIGDGTRGICTPTADSGKIYFTGSSVNGVYEWQADAGGGLATIIEGSTSPIAQQAACDATHMYWTEYNPANPKGGVVVGYSIAEHRRIFQIKDQDFPCSIAAADGYVYWTTCGEKGAVLRAKVP